MNITDLQDAIFDAQGGTLNLGGQSLTSLNVQMIVRAAADPSMDIRAIDLRKCQATEASLMNKLIDGLRAVENAPTLLVPDRTDDGVNLAEKRIIEMGSNLSSGAMPHRPDSRSEMSETLTAVYTKPLGSAGARNAVTHRAG